MTVKESIKVEQYASQILDLFSNKDEMTNSDFSGCLDAIVIKIMKGGESI